MIMPALAQAWARATRLGITMPPFGSLGTRGPLRGEMWTLASSVTASDSGLGYSRRGYS